MDIRSNKQVLEFKAAAEAFCNLLEQDIIDRDTHLWSIQAALATVYALGFQLPDVESFHAPPNDSFETYLQTKRIPLNHFEVLTELHEAYENSEDPNFHTIDVDLVEIYDDLRERLILWESPEGDYAGDAVFEWKESHRTHWGVHAVQVLKCLHYFETGIQGWC